MWTEVQLDAAHEAARMYMANLIKALREAGMGEEDVSEIVLLDRQRSKECGYGYAPAVLFEHGDAHFDGPWVMWHSLIPVDVPRGFSVEEYTSYAVNIFPDPCGRAPGRGQPARQPRRSDSSGGGSHCANMPTT